MPTIYTGTADIPFQAGYKAGKTARQMYEEEKAREDARLKAQLDSQREHLNFTKQKAEYEHLEMLAKLAQEKVKSETELMLNNKSADDKRKQWALEKIYDKYGSNTDLNNPEIQKEFLNNYVTSKQIFDTDLSWANRDMLQQPQGQGQPPSGGISDDENKNKPLTLKETEANKTLGSQFNNLANEASNRGVVLSEEDMNLPTTQKIVKLRKLLSEKPQKEEIRQKEINDRLITTMVPKLNKDIEGQNDVIKKISQLEDKIGFKLEDFNNQNIEGMNLPLLGRVNTSEKSKEIQNIITGIINSKIYDSSGKAITDNEFKRIADEMGISKGSLFSTEKNMLEALKRFKENVVLKAQNTKLSYPDIVIENYKSKGGKLLFDNESTGTVRMQAPDGTIADIPKEKVDAFIKKGAKVI